MPPAPGCHRWPLIARQPARSCQLLPRRPSGRRGVLDTGPHHVRSVPRRLQVPDPLELPRVLVPSYHLVVVAGHTLVGELVAHRLPGRAAVVGALDDLAEPAARLRGVDPVRVHGRSLDVVDLQPPKKAAHVPARAPAVGGQHERALARAHQHSELRSCAAPCRDRLPWPYAPSGAASLPDPAAADPPARRRRTRRPRSPASTRADHDQALLLDQALEQLGAVAQLVGRGAHVGAHGEPFQPRPGRARARPPAATPPRAGCGRRSSAGAATGSPVGRRSSSRVASTAPQPECPSTTTSGCGSAPRRTRRCPPGTKRPRCPRRGSRTGRPTPGRRRSPPHARVGAAEHDRERFLASGQLGAPVPAGRACPGTNGRHEAAVALAQAVERLARRDHGRLLRAAAPATIAQRSWSRQRPRDLQVTPRTGPPGRTPGCARARSKRGFRAGRWPRAVEPEPGEGVRTARASASRIRPSRSKPAKT